MTNPRREAADIARAVRRCLERERAAGGGGELLADGATRAQREGVPPRSQAGRGGLPARLEPPVPAPATVPMATNLFGEPEVPPAPKHRALSLLDEPALEIFAEGLNPGGLAARAALAAQALPVLEQIADEARACTQCGLC